MYGSKMNRTIRCTQTWRRTRTAQVRLALPSRGPAVGDPWLHDIVYNVAKFPWEPPEIDSCVDMEI